ncbi:MAG: 3-deoxy-7-phosphoheptulonate synthase [Dehalococcoidia bacterium]|nr:3-deoxy-7-phosphoheptulonate synthase [Dehalococcoidia bacterium]
MMVVMKKDHTKEELQEVLDHLKENGLGAHMSVGVERTVIGVLGHIYPELAEEIEAFPGVEETIPITRPYKLAGRELKPEDTVVKVGNVAIGGGTVVVMAGECSIESEEQMMATARLVKETGGHILRGGAFKPRTSPHAFRGLGEEGLKILAAARAETGLPIVTEVMDPRDVDMVAGYADILQIGTRNAQNYFLLDEVGRCGKPVLLKRGMASTVEDWLLCAEYILARGNGQVILCERGIRTFETGTRFTLDISSIPLAKRLSHLPVVADPSHGTGRWYLVEPMCLAAVAAGADGVMVEIHPNPDRALSDGAQSLKFDKFRRLMQRLDTVAEAVGRPLARR